MVINRQVITSLIFFIVLVLIFFTPVGGFLKTQLGKFTDSAPAQTEDLKLEESLSVEDWQLQLKGYGVSDAELSDFKGTVLFINFWGTWCPPCLKEMPSIQKLYEAQGKEVEFVSIAVQDKPENFVPYLKENQFTFPVYEANSLLPKSLKPNVFPTTLIINKQGEVALKEEITKDWNSPEIQDFLQKLIKE